MRSCHASFSCAFLFDAKLLSRRWQRARVWVAAMLVTCSLGALAAPDPEAVPKEDQSTAEKRALTSFQRGYLLHMFGRYSEAVVFYRQSIEAYPTAEAHTFLGWSLSYLGHLEEAIVECKQAIELDPDFGNPYNDIGVYLIDLGRFEESVPWFERALQAKRYCCYHYPHYNLGRVLLHQGDVDGAQKAFRRALEIEPGYLPALEALKFIDAMGTKV